MQTINVSQEKTCRELFTEFKDRYSIQEMEEHAQLARLFTYLQHRGSTSNGNYFHEPKEDIKRLLEKFLRYNPSKKPTPGGELNPSNNAAQR